MESIRIGCDQNCTQNCDGVGGWVGVVGVKRMGWVDRGGGGQGDG